MLLNDDVYSPPLSISVSSRISVVEQKKGGGKRDRLKDGRNLQHLSNPSSVPAGSSPLPHPPSPTFLAPTLVPDARPRPSSFPKNATRIPRWRGGTKLGRVAKVGPHPSLEGREVLRVMQDSAGHIPQSKGVAHGSEKGGSEGLVVVEAQHQRRLNVVDVEFRRIPESADWMGSPGREVQFRRRC
ncbi:hypothetical protein BDN70DRAFT_939830 [Pholiota conissans]|uniref:Uncharacterized protein n=1 Tax=Pholiota conissans TaxID=109636 RepID=A0A9P6CRQ9_9AGAR|nr:hypothetical protein BDN70DRAFT_939830 [Pholiota conissans]